MKQKFSVRRLSIRFGFLVLLAMTGLFGISWSAKLPKFPAEADGERFAACPASPNCVSTQATSSEQRMEPILWEGSTADAVNEIKRTMARQFSRAELAAEKPGYLRYKVSSFVFRFVDDVEFLFNEKLNRIEFRSASRVGHSDLGANRRRMNQFVAAFENRADQLD